MNDFHCNNDFITEAVNNYSDSMYRVAFNITGNREDAFDVCQDVFVRFVRNSHKIKDEEHLKAWLFRATINCAKSNATQASKRHCVGEEAMLGLSVPNVSNDLVEAVMSLPEKYRTVIHLFYYEDMRIKEIAKVLNVTQSAVKSRLRRGREKLRVILEKENLNEH